jgi:hypothetical protein
LHAPAERRAFRLQGLDGCLLGSFCFRQVSYSLVFDEFELPQFFLILLLRF